MAHPVFKCCAWLIAVLLIGGCTGYSGLRGPCYDGTQGTCINVSELIFDISAIDGLAKIFYMRDQHFGHYSVQDLTGKQFVYAISGEIVENHQRTYSHCLGASPSDEVRKWLDAPREARGERELQEIIKNGEPIKRELFLKLKASDGSLRGAIAICTDDNLDAKSYTKAVRILDSFQWQNQFVVTGF